MTTAPPYRDRIEAGQILAQHLTRYARPGVLVLGLPRGGVPVALEVARALHAPLDVFLVRKLGVPGEPELAMGAIASGGVEVLSDAIVEEHGVRSADIARVAAREKAELARREKLYRRGRSPVDAAGQTVLLIDDGLATGASMRAAIAALRAQRPAAVVVGAPVGSAQACAMLAEAADEVVCPLRPEPFRSVGLWYAEFEPTSDEEVQTCLEQAADEPGVSARGETGRHWLW